MYLIFLVQTWLITLNDIYRHQNEKKLLLIIIFSSDGEKQAAFLTGDEQI